MPPQLERVWKVHAARGRAVRGQYSFLKAKYEPRMVPPSFDLPVANLNFEPSSAGMFHPFGELEPNRPLVSGRQRCTSR
jgi:hypothetical protein